MHLHGLLAHTEFDGDLLVEKTGGNEVAHLPLAFGETCEPLLGIVLKPLLLAHGDALQASPFERGQQLIFVDRLLEKIDRSPRIARTVDGTSLWALRKMIGIEMPLAIIAVCTSRPLMPGIFKSSSRQATPSYGGRARNASGEVNPSTAMLCERSMRSIALRTIGSSSTAKT